MISARIKQEFYFVFLPASACADQLKCSVVCLNEHCSLTGQEKGSLHPHILCSLHNTMKRDGPLMHPRVQKWPCAEPQCWQSINLCKPKRAISKYKPMSVWLFSHLQPLTAVTLNQCLWIVWLEKPPHPPQSKACLLVYILNTLFTLHCPLPNRFSSSCPRVLFTSITRF